MNQGLRFVVFSNFGEGRHRVSWVGNFEGWMFNETTRLGLSPHFEYFRRAFYLSVKAFFKVN